MNTIIVLSVVIGCILCHVQLSFAIRCYNCSSHHATDCASNLNQRYAIDCDRLSTTCYVVFGDSASTGIYDVQRGCGKLNQDSQFDVDYPDAMLPLIHIETCSLDLCNKQEPNKTDVTSCYACSTIKQPECRFNSHTFNTTCEHIVKDAKSAFCYKLEFTYGGRHEIQHGCGVFHKNDTIIGVPNRFEAHIDRLNTCPGSLCNSGERKKPASSYIKYVVGGIILFVVLGLIVAIYLIFKK